MAFVSECLQSPVVEVGDDDSTMVVDAHSSRLVELAWLIAFGAELEQERAIDQRQYLHSIIVGINDNDSVSIIIDRNACWIVELARSRSFVAADLEQEREIDRRQEHQSIAAAIGDDCAMMMLVDRNIVRIDEPEIS